MQGQEQAEVAVAQGLLEGDADLGVDGALADAVDDASGGYVFCRTGQPGKRCEQIDFVNDIADELTGLDYPRPPGEGGLAQRALVHPSLVAAEFPVHRLIESSADRSIGVE